MRPAIFLDRDGVIIENRPDYVRSWADVEIFDQAMRALAKLRDSPFLLIIVTNQSAIGRGIITAEQAHSINTQLIQTIMHSGGRIDGVYMCPHAPKDNCKCRKPRPGLLKQAAQDLSVDLSSSIMIGDALTDLLAGKTAGVPQLALVRTGRGAAQDMLPAPPELGSYPVYNTLAEALDKLVDSSGS
jgi:D-glycero-D-manno-heptose 1,7-bisphosphate phosphatase